jgi:hypothetical protein
MKCQCVKGKGKGLAIQPHMSLFPLVVFLNSALDGHEWPSLRTRRFMSGKEPLVPNV